MNRLLSLDDFDTNETKVSATPDAPPEPSIDIEEIRSAAYESGYESGWEDCRKAQSQSSEAVTTDLQQSLKDATFTYEEARADVIKSLQPVLHAIVEQLLPGMASAGLASVFAEKLLPILVAQSDLKQEIVAAPASLPAIEALLVAHGIQVKLRPEPAYAEAQVSLHMASEHHDINLAAVLQEITAVIDDFSQQSGTGMTQNEGSVA